MNWVTELKGKASTVSAMPMLPVMLRQAKAKVNESVCPYFYCLFTYRTSGKKALQGEDLQNSTNLLICATCHPYEGSNILLLANTKIKRETIWSSFYYCHQRLVPHWMLLALMRKMIQVLLLLAKKTVLH